MLFALCQMRGMSPSVPGLHVYQGFLQEAEARALQGKAMDLHRAILRNCPNGVTQKGRSYLSQQHNLKSEEFYRLVQIGGKITCQHFEKYGGVGHKLSYFIGNENVPGFLKESLIPRVLEVPEVAKICQGRSLEWNFTFNTYAARIRGELAGFNYHKDIDSNGEVTMIYSLGAPSEFHIRHPKMKDREEVPLRSNSLVLLSEEARWDYEHCVVPVKVDDTPPLAEGMAIRRVSLVLGFSRR